MSEFENTMEITEIEFEKHVQAFCPLGKAYCTYELTVTIHPNLWIPDYCELEAFLNKMAGGTMTIEECVDQVYGHIWLVYRPHHLVVSLYCGDAVHFPVTVTKDSDFTADRLE